MEFLIFIIPIYIISVLICGFFAESKIKTGDSEVIKVIFLVILSIIPCINTMIAIFVTLTYWGSNFKWSSQQVKFTRR